MERLGRFIAFLSVLLVVALGVTVGMKIADGWQTRHTDTLIGGGLAITGICAIAVTVVPVVFLLLAFMRRQAARDAARAGEYIPPASPHAMLPGIDAIRYQQAMTRLERDQLALEQARQKATIVPSTGRGLIEDDSIWQPVQGVWVDDTV